MSYSVLNITKMPFFQVSAKTFKSSSLENKTQNTILEKASLELTDRVYKELDNTEIPIAIFLDLSKAFDIIAAWQTDISM